MTEGEPAAQLLSHILHGRLGIDPTEHPLMITEPAWNTQKAREMLTEMVFEGEKMPALYFGSQGVTSASVNQSQCVLRMLNSQICSWKTYRSHC